MKKPVLTLDELLNGVTESNMHWEVTEGSFINSTQPGSTRLDNLPELTPDPVIEFYKKDIDRTLIRANLRLSVEQRFEKHMALQRFAEELRRAGVAARQKAFSTQD